MDFGIEGKVAMVAAASKGIGLAAAKALHAEGCRVSICARDRTGIDDAVAQLPGGIGRACDVTKSDEIERWHADTVKLFGAVSILVTNTGGPPAGSLGEMTDEDWQQGFESTLLNILRLCRIAAPHMRAANWGRIVHITSLVAMERNDILPISTTLRSGIRGLTKLQAADMGAHGITVNAVLPGHTMTERQSHLAEVVALREGISHDQYFERLARSIPVKRIADAEAIAAPIAFLCSRQAWFVNGASCLSTAA